ncbi:MAG TPA: hypothetical protein VL261_16700 [Nitrospira sp.]|jgi:hypothetical protein|nr:hypothetical protein [Nitrospira sp.]
MDQSAPFHNFSNACEHFLFSLGKKPLTESEARIVAYYCKELLAIAQSSLATQAGLPNVLTATQNHSSKSAA